ncbi:MAG: twin-arginine translocase TatA/TatE family subunit [Alphaproteobacteria bacterium]|jgi:sec-independent protein translocase protein TatA|nr:twin-arginine translocase TatA/TatE family subunit [Alphaproteobacteria bacterium]
MRFGATELIIILLIVLILFGKGKIASIMEELGKGVSSFKKGIKEEKKSKKTKDKKK